MSKTGSDLPRVAITIGDAAGIGPEVVVKSFAGLSLPEFCRPVIVGDARVIREAADLAGTRTEFEVVTEIPENYGAPLIYDLANLADPFEVGKDSAATGRAAAENISAVTIFRATPNFLPN
jgi:4-hydroxy-L-threonine phosphate dehydrogenase PdxA